VAVAAAFTIQVGAAMVATHFVVADIGPATLAMLRYAIGFLCLVPALVATGTCMRFAARDLVPIAGLGIVQFGVLIALLNVGLQTVPAGRASLVFATFPLLTMLVAALLGREGLSWAKSVGRGPSPASRWRRRSSRWRAARPRGEAIVLLAALCGRRTVLYRPYIALFRSRWAPWRCWRRSRSWRCWRPARPAAALPRLGWVLAILFGPGSGAGHFLWLWALSRTTPTRSPSSSASAR
jgi:drug/metabolite transporter (DMT)-like permease